MAGPAQAPKEKPPRERSDQKKKRAEKFTQDQQAGRHDRALRSDFQHFRDQTDRDGQDLTNLNTSTLAERLQQSNKLSERVQRPREQAVDSEIFASLADAGMSMAKKLAHGGQGHTAKDFLRRLKEAHAAGDDPQEDGRDNIDAMGWTAVGHAVATMYRPAVGVCCMLGPLTSQAKQRKVIVCHKKAPTAAVVRPDEVQEVEEADKQETDRNMEEIWLLLKKKGGPIPLLELVMNPHPDLSIGFGQTVENLFGLSFLVRDSKACLYKDADAKIMVKVVPQNKGAPEGDREQFMIAQDFATWQRWRSHVEPTDCLMRHRKIVAGRNGELDTDRMQEAGHGTAGGSATQPDAATPTNARGDGGSGSGSQRHRSQNSSGRKGPKIKQSRPRPEVIPDDSEAEDVAEATPPPTKPEGQPKKRRLVKH